MKPVVSRVSLHDVCITTSSCNLGVSREGNKRLSVYSRKYGTYDTASSSPSLLRRKDGEDGGCEGERRSEGVTEWCGKDIEECERECSVSIPFPATCT